MAGDASINWIVRNPSRGEIPSLVAMCNKFFDSTGYSEITHFDAESLAATLEVVMKDGALLVVEKEGVLIGLAGALLYPFYFNLHHTTAQELFWWVDPNHRGVGKELFLALKQEVKKKGAKTLSMISLETSPEWVGEFYQSHGFRPSERSYIGRL